jgi:hypothetical protein
VYSEGCRKVRRKWPHATPIRDLEEGFCQCEEAMENAQEKILKSLSLQNIEETRWVTPWK